MRIQVIGAASVAPGYPLHGFLIDDQLAIDAGALGWFASVEVQAQIRHIFLTHSHLDHIAGLPILLDNIYGLQTAAPVVYGLPETLAALKNHLFNNLLMPDFVELSRQIAPFLELRELHPGQELQLGQYRVLPIAVEHTVPTVGYVIDDGDTAVLFITDTSPVPQLYSEMATIPRLRAVFLEASFPDEQAELARISMHLTSSQFVEWGRHFPADVPVYAIHIKPRYHDKVMAEILASGRRNLLVAEPGLIVEL
jgi:ribonuclease BN (tRNA processing enzyme)